METILGLCIGLGLAASCGFRVFVPLLVLSIGAKAGMVHLSEHAAFLSSTPMMIGLTFACVLEVVAYWVPWLDHALDTVATPSAVVAGTIAAASQMGHLDPGLAWTASAITGGGVAAVSQVVNVSTRGLSTVGTGGVLNPIISAVQTVISAILAVISIVAPIVAGVLLLCLIGVVWRRFHTRRTVAKRRAGLA